MCSFLFLKCKSGGAAVSEQQLRRANEKMRHRGPHGSVLKVANSQFVLLHNILHLCGTLTQQPVVKGNIALLFNGEIYNWKSLSGSLNSNSDTDVLIPLYEKYGVDFVRMLDGEFAICLMDMTKGIIVVSSDVFMTKPLWVAKRGGGGGAGDGDCEYGVATYKSALSVFFDDDDIKLVRPNTTVVYDLATFDIVKERSVFDFDLEQKKTDLVDWEKAFEEAVMKRAMHGGRFFLSLSSGYDSGCIALALDRLGIPYDTFSTFKNENVDVLKARLKNGRIRGRIKTCKTLAEVNPSVHVLCKDMIQQKCEDWTYVHDDSGRSGSGERTRMCDDGGAKALAYICNTMSQFGYNVVLSGSGADEIYSDYGFRGQKIYAHSEFGGLWPTELDGGFFPWRKFYDDTQRSYLFKDEFVAGGWGIEGRYPFLDKKLVQEWLWLSCDLKNKDYKYPLVAYMQKYGYPCDLHKKYGFNL